MAEAPAAPARRRKRDIDTAAVKPPLPKIDFAAVPAALQQLPQWVTWKYEPGKEGRWTKVPYQANNPKRKASTTAPATWASWPDATRLCRKWPEHRGVGFVFAAGGGLVGVDLDDCRDPDTGVIDGWGRELIAALDSYSEISPSGTGVKVFLRGLKPPGRSKAKFAGGEVEVYVQGRYFTVTGRRVPGTNAQVQERQAALEAVCARVLAHEGEAPSPHWANHALAAADGDGAKDEVAHLSDAEVLDRAGRARNGDKFRRLYGGDSSGYAATSRGPTWRYVRSCATGAAATWPRSIGCSAGRG